MNEAADKRSFHKNGSTNISLTPSKSKPQKVSEEAAVIRESRKRAEEIMIHREYDFDYLETI